MSIINRNNYEEYFLLYTDDELSPAEKRAVEEFVEQHPDLKVELEMLQQSVLPSEPVIFYDKEVLLKTSSSIINELNYEEYFVLYADDELNNEQKDCVEQFVYQHPSFKAEFELIQRARLQPDSQVVYPDKASLYRTENEGEKVVAIRWWRIAVAAVFIVFLSGLGWYMLSNDQSAPPTATVTSPKGPVQVVPDDAPTKKDEIAQSNAVRPSASSEKTSSIDKQVRSKNPIAKKKVEQLLLTAPQKEDKIGEGRNIQVASAVTNEKGRVDVEKMETRSSVAMSERKEIIDEQVGVSDANPYVITASSDDEIEILNTTISKKNKLRGLLRKVSRVVEKTTNIEGDGRGVRFANLEIALK